MTPKKRPIHPKTLQNSIERLFDEVSDSDNLSAIEETEESERSADEHEEQTNQAENQSSNSSVHDPFSDPDGEFGYDHNYNPDEDEARSSDFDRTRSSIIIQPFTPTTIQTRSQPVSHSHSNRSTDREIETEIVIEIAKKSIRWYKKVFFHLLDMMICNAFYLYKKHCNSKSTLLNFRESIIKSYLQVKEQTLTEMRSKIIKESSSSRRAVQPHCESVEENEATVQFEHWPELIPITANTKRTKLFIKCRVCTKNKKIKQTSYRCKGCLEKPALCPGCFETWHKDTVQSFR